jgi:hypothetical protein
VWKSDGAGGSNGKSLTPILWRVVLGVTIFALLLAVWIFIPANGPAIALVKENTIRILDSKSRELWTLHYPMMLRTGTPDGLIGTQVRIEDLDGDGRSEVVVLPQPMDTEADALLCYNDKGKLQWKHEERSTVRTSQVVYDPLFKLRAFTVLPAAASGKRRIAVAAIHNLYWPSSVATLDHEGKKVAEYWHGGHVQVLAARNGRLYAGGVRNMTGQADLAVLDPDTMSGASKEDEAHQLIGMGVANEVARYAFRRSCLSQRVAAISAVNGIEFSSNGVLVHTLERTEGSYPVLIWAFNPKLQFEGVTESSVYTKQKAEADPACRATERLVAERVDGGK